MRDATLPDRHTELPLEQLVFPGEARDPGSNSPSPRTRVPLPWRRGATAGGRLGATWQRAAMSAHGDFDVLVIGAGFGGMYMVHSARQHGLRVHALEAGGDVGGTWYWNRYPGARCDVESLEYSYGFSDDLQQDWVWTERYASQPEILAYADHVATRFDLRRDISFTTTVRAATFDEERSRWIVRTEAGEELSGQFLVTAIGCLSAANIPPFPGLEHFGGEWQHTGRWPATGLDFSGKRVGVIGTGSSGVQSIPVIAGQAEKLFVFQRTPAYTVPAHNRALSGEEEKAIKADYPAFRAANRLMITAMGSRFPLNDVSALAVSPDERERLFEERWERGGLGFMGSFNDLLIDAAANELAAAFVRNKIRTIVEDPDVAGRLCPTTTIGCKRLCVDTGYYATFNRDNVELVDVAAAPITEITAAGLRTTERAFDLDCIVFATGFDAMTGALSRIDIRGRGGMPLTDAWAEGPRTYLGLGVAGFPNLFTITGPGSPSVLANMVVAVEQHVDWITGCIEHLRTRGVREIEPTAEAQDAWVTFVADVADFTLFPTCNSWYLGANIEGKRRVFMPLLGFPEYVEQCERVAAKGYEGFALI